MASGELEFEAPLARFDVDEWTEYQENTSDEEEQFGISQDPVDSVVLVASPRPVLTENESSSDGSNVTENFSETCSGSLEDLVNCFDQRVTKCCRNYEEHVERLAPVQMRSQEEAHDSCQYVVLMVFPGEVYCIVILTVLLQNKWISISSSQSLLVFSGLFDSSIVMVRISARFSNHHAVKISDCCINVLMLTVVLSTE